MRSELFEKCINRANKKDKEGKEFKDLTVEVQDQIKENSILKMSGQHLLYYVLNKKPNSVEHDFINNLMEILIEMNLDL
jgi:regulator of replication initiation timing